MRSESVEGRRCSDCEVAHNDWEKITESGFRTTDGSHAGVCTVLECGRCGSRDEVVRP